MKRLTALLCALTLCLLCACGSASQPYSPDLADKLLESDAFSEPLEPLDAEIACFIYQLDELQAELTDLRAHRSAGATCEEVAVFTFRTESAAAAALPVLQAYLTTRLEDCRDYMPDQAVKVEQATLSQRVNTLLLLIPGDRAAAEDLLP